MDIDSKDRDFASVLCSDQAACPLFRFVSDYACLWQDSVLVWFWSLEALKSVNTAKGPANPRDADLRVILKVSRRESAISWGWSRELATSARSLRTEAELCTKSFITRLCT